MQQSGKFPSVCLALVLCLPAAGLAREERPAGEQVEVVVYGATPAGIAAALAAAEPGRRVLLVEPTGRIGGMMTNGLSHTDFRTYEGLTGAFLAFSRRVEEYYAGRYGEGSPQVRDCFRGTQAEPHVNLLVFERLLADQPGISVRRHLWLESVHTDAAEAGRIVSAAFVSREGHRIQVEAAMFIDATYEGDLMAAAGIEYRVGREARRTYGEPLAPDEADGQVQGYNFRLR